MAVTGLGGVTGFSAGLGIKNSCGAAGYTRIAGAGLGLFKISWGKYLKGSVIFGWLAFFFYLWFFLLVVYGCIVLYGPEVCSDTKIDVGQPN